MSDAIVKIIHSKDIRFAIVIDGILYAACLKRNNEKWFFYMIDKPFITKGVKEVFHTLFQQKHVKEVLDSFSIKAEEVEYKLFSENTSDEELYFLFH